MLSAPCHSPWTTITHNNLDVTYVGFETPIDQIIEALGHIPNNTAPIENCLKNESLSFGMILHNQKNNTSIGVCDRVQGYSIYYDTISGAISHDVSTFPKKEICDHSVLEFTTAGYVLGENTLCKNIKQLQSGEIVHIDKSQSPPKITTHRYYRYTPAPLKTSSSEEEWERKLGAVLDSIIKRMIKSIGNRSICLPLSGGLDSRLILAKLCEHGAKNIQTFSYGLNNNFEAKTAQKVAHILNMPWFMAAARPNDAQNLFNSDIRKNYNNFAHGYSKIPNYVEFEAIHTVTKEKLIPENAVIVNGQSGDYISGGHIPACLYENKNPTENDMYRYIFDKHFSLWINLKTPEIEEKIRNHISEILLPYNNDLSQKDNLIHQYESFEWQERQSKMVVHGQKNYNYFGYDWRLPLWDKELMDFFETVPWELKYKQKLFKSYLQNWNYKGLFDFMSAEPEMWQPQQFWIKWVARAIGIIKSPEAKADYYKKMSYYSDSHWQYALFSKDLYDTHYKNIRNMISLTILDYLKDQNIDFPNHRGVK